jgi:hypothetical protein
MRRFTSTSMALYQDSPSERATLIAPKAGLGREAFTLCATPPAVRVTPAENGTVNVVPSGSWYVRAKFGGIRLTSKLSGIRAPFV